MKRFLTIACATALIAGASTVVAAKPLVGHELAKGAKGDLAQARAIALKARPGRIVDQELEKEAGGSNLRYSFDVSSGGRTYEVGVDAVTGRVLENGAESATKEAAETRSEHKPPAHAAVK
jgi:hypothetical protein